MKRRCENCIWHEGQCLEDKPCEYYTPIDDSKECEDEYNAYMDEFADEYNSNLEKDEEEDDNT